MTTDDVPDAVDGLTRRQEQAIAALLAQPSVEKAAETCDIKPRTLYRWLQEENFQSAYMRARRQAFSHATSLTQRYAPRAVQTLAQIMTDVSAGMASRVAAAVAIMRFGREAIELDDLAVRVDAIERRLLAANSSDEVRMGLVIDQPTRAIEPPACTQGDDMNASREEGPT